MAEIADILDRPIAYHRVFVTLTGSVTAAVMLSQAVYWQRRPRKKQAGEWWYKTTEEWEEETGLTRHEQETARRRCGRYLKSDLRDIPARLYWRVDLAALRSALLAENGQTSFPESGNLDNQKETNINRNTETTHETNRTTTTTTATASILACYAANIGKLTPAIQEALKEAEAFYPAGWVLEALTETALHGKRNWKYTQAILKRWGSEGKKPGTISAATRAMMNY